MSQFNKDKIDVLDNCLTPDVEMERPRLPIIYEWMKDEKDTNSGYPLIGIRISSDFMDVECPKCKSRHELTHDHLDYFKPPAFIQIIQVVFIVLGVYKAIELIIKFAIINNLS